MVSYQHLSKDSLLTHNFFVRVKFSPLRVHISQIILFQNYLTNGLLQQLRRFPIPEQMNGFSSPFLRCRDGESVRLFVYTQHNFHPRCLLYWQTFSAMEDAHAAVLALEGPNEKSNTFFAVYDGHGGMFQKTDYLVFLNTDLFSPRIDCCSICGSECAPTVGHRRIVPSGRLRSCPQEGFLGHRWGSFSQWGFFLCSKKALWSHRVRIL